MNNQLIFNFNTDISSVKISPSLNNPFVSYIPEIAKIATKEFQEFIASESQNWKHDLHAEKGKMFGVLVVQKEDATYGYLGTISGKIPGNEICRKLVPSSFDGGAGSFFDKGMEALTEIGNEIKNTTIQAEIISLTKYRKQKSIALQQKLFENYNFLNILGDEINILEIFKRSSHGKPPSAAGECTAPKLLHHAFKHQLKPIALAEFWWGTSLKNKDKEHQLFYPACKSKCRPILEYMLNDTELFNQASSGYETEN